MIKLLKENFDDSQEIMSTDDFENLDYDEQAEYFCDITDTKIKIVCKQKGVRTPWDEKKMHNRYTVYLIRNGNKVTFPFYDSIHNYQNNKKPSKYDVLTAMSSDASAGEYDFIDFCNAFGYDIYNDKGKSENIWKKCVDMLKKAKDVLGYTDDEMELLYYIR